MAITKQALLIGSGVGAVSVGGYTALYLSQDRTIKDKLITLGETLIDKSEEYQAVFKEFKDEEELMKLISKADKKITSSNKDNEGGTALETWCKENLEKPLTDTEADNLTKKAQKYCTKAPSTIEEKYLKKGKKLVTGWEEKLEKIKPTDDNDKDELLKDLNVKQVNEATKESLEKWCGENITKKLSEDSEASIWKKVNTRCLEE